TGAPRAWVDASLAACGLLAAAGLVFAMAFPGGEHGRQAVCDSLVGAGLDRGICAGSIDWLRKGTADGMTAVSSELGGYLRVYPMLFLFACIPFLLTDWPKRRLPLLAVGFAATLPLYFVAVDWGRWIHIYIFLVSVTLLHESAQAPVAIRKVPGAALIAYLVLWDLPHCCVVWPGLWVVSMLHDLARGAFSF
ncbi:MAG TPA: hypothetical protein VH105_14760, partial [Burkholderiales bacterium]|nr:hypothetical protein [Burkholderiales bacterium]